MDVVHPERAASLPIPSLLIFNYQGPYVPLAILRALPARIRVCVAVAVDASPHLLSHLVELGAVAGSTRGRQQAFLHPPVMRHLARSCPYTTTAAS